MKIRGVEKVESRWGEGSFSFTNERISPLKEKIHRLLSNEVPVSLRVSDLHKDFLKGGQIIRVLKGIDLELSHGKIICITGASGVGKSTFLQILGLLDTPTSGEIFFGDVSSSALTEGEKALMRNRLIGFIFQFHYLLKEFTALENTMIPCLISGSWGKETRMRAEEILIEVGLKDRLNHLPGELSGGEQQRVAVARALIMNPKIVLADEPTGNLDPDTGLKVLDLILRLNSEKKITSIIVTHNPAVAERIDIRYRLADGRLIPEQGLRSL